MLKSMTGFGSKEAEVADIGKVSVELRSSNHKFLEVVFHLPVGFLSLEDRIKKEIESKIKRGRITCAINITGAKASSVFINKHLLKNYLSALKNIKKYFHVSEEISLDTLIHLPGVLSLGENRIVAANVWPRLKVLVRAAVGELMDTRQKEGKALSRYLKKRACAIKVNLASIKSRFKKAVKDKSEALSTNEERSSFLKESDVTEEIERLSFHIINFESKLLKSFPVGKELDFIAQEMQREANTLAAKSFDTSISAKIVQVKSLIEKIREQVQNIE